jgi:hypothetical protein
MANLFDTANVPETEPTKIVSGDILQWKRTDLDTDYANSSYTLTYKARLEGTGSSASYTPGVYRWQAYITRTSDSERITVDSGTFEVVANRSTATSDPRSHAKIMVDKIESLLEGRADADVSSYSIAGRSLNKLTLDELMTWRDRYRAEWLREVRRERALNGDRTGGTILARF